MPVAFNPKHWRDLPPDSLESLWLIEKSGSDLTFVDRIIDLKGGETKVQTKTIAINTPEFHGGFVPEIPLRLMLRFSKPGWVVYDPMAGMMTTHRVGSQICRDVISVDVADHFLGDLSVDELAIQQNLILADAREYNPGPVDLIIWHPPYRDIIKFSDDYADLSTMNIDEYWASMQACMRQFDKCLKPNRMISVVIGDIYKDSGYVPLATRLLDISTWATPSWKLKAWIIKDVQGNRQGQDGLWRYRACAGDTVMFKHEHILVWLKGERT
jgi:DNA modification methylase